MWKEGQGKLAVGLSSVEGSAVLSGDGRSDSPGHSAKYGAFTGIEQRANKVLDVQLVQVSYPLLVATSFLVRNQFRIVQ